MADEGFRAPKTPSYIVGFTLALILLGVYAFFLIKMRILPKNTVTNPPDKQESKDRDAVMSDALPDENKKDCINESADAPTQPEPQPADNSEEKKLIN